MALCYLVSIFLHPGTDEVLRQYEQHVVPVMQRHDGEILYVLKPTKTPTDGEADEMQLLAFESEQGFLSFRRDPELQQFGYLREAAVKHTHCVTLRAIPLVDSLTPCSRNLSTPGRQRLPHNLPQLPQMRVLMK